MLAEEVCTASYVKWTWPYGSLHSHNSVGRSVTFLRQRPLFLLENQTTVVLSHLLTYDLFVSNSTVKRSSLRPLDKSTGCIMIGPSNGPNVCGRSQCMWTSVCELTNVPIVLIKGLESALKHRNSAFTRSRRTFYLSLERSCSCARVRAN